MYSFFFGSLPPSFPLCSDGKDDPTRGETVLQRRRNLTVQIDAGVTQQPSVGRTATQSQLCLARRSYSCQPRRAGYANAHSVWRQFKLSVAVSAILADCCHWSFFNNFVKFVKVSMSAAAGGAMGEAHRVGGDVTEALSLLSK